MKRDNPFRLITLGRIALVDPHGRDEESLGKRRRKLALLAMVALSPRPLPRDLLIEIFWGDQDEARARHSLSDTLSHLRRVLGRAALSTRSADVALSEDAPLVVDSREFERVVEAQDFATAVSLYAGPFLDGIHVEDSPRWDQWVSRERVKLEESFLKACDKQCMALARARRWPECGELAARWLEISPASTDAALYRMNALKAPGTREADARALEEFGRLEARLRRELEVSPAPAVVALAKSIAGRLAEAGERTGEVDAVRADAAAVTPESVMASSAEARGTVAAPGEARRSGESRAARSGDAGVEDSVAGRSEIAPAGGPPRTTEYTTTPPLLPDPTLPAATGSFPATTQEWRAMRAIPVPATTGEWRVLRDRLTAPHPVVEKRPHLRWPAALAAVLVIIALVLAGTQLRARTTRQAAAAGVAGKPSVAIVGISTSGDSTRGWLRDGLAQMMAATLSRTTAVEIVTPERVRQIVARAQLDTSPIISRERLLDIGKRLGATWVVSGGVSGADSTFVFDVNVHDVTTGERVSFSVVEARSPMALAEAAAARVLDAAGSASSGPRLADIETSSVEAYERYTRASLANSQGRHDDARRDADAAIALDSSFVSAIRLRLGLAASPEEVERYSALFNRHAHRASDFDRYWTEANDAMLAGEHARSEALGRNFVARFPRDPRAYELLAHIYGHHGRFDEVLRTLQAELALDSLALEVGSGACAACGAYQGITEAHMLQANNAEAIRAAQRWVELQPDAPAAWFLLSRVYLADQQFAAALETAERTLAMSGGRDPRHLLHRARIRMAMRDYDAAEREIMPMLSSPDERLRSFAYDAITALHRERGTIRQSLSWTDRALRDIPGMNWLELVRGNSLARIGRYAEAERIYEAATHVNPLEPMVAPAHSARAYAWHHALMADAIAPVADTTQLDALADTLVMVSPRSYYGRDWRLADHVRGLSQMRKGQYEQAAASFRRALWIPVGWTRTNAELARAELALGRPSRALDILRPAYGAPLDAMGRYLTRSELDFLMAKAFRQAGEADSAMVYAARVRAAWREADPEIRRQLAELE
jgi:DNA-binding SARP family transcriptional activator/tetratricopeptide (TPR) repeat protein/TolB-like protein